MDAYRTKAGIGWFLGQSDLSRILQTLDDVGIEAQAIENWRRRRTREYSKLFGRVPRGHPAFTVEGEIERIANLFRKFALPYLPEKLGSPREALLRLHALQKSARACGRSRTKLENERTRLALHEHLDAVARSATARDYLVHELEFVLRARIEKPIWTYLRGIQGQLIFQSDECGWPGPPRRPTPFPLLEGIVTRAALAVRDDFGDHPDFEINEQNLPALEELLDRADQGDREALLQIEHDARSPRLAELPRLSRGGQPDEAARRAIFELADLLLELAGREEVQYSVDSDGRARPSTAARFIERFFEACNGRDDRLPVPIPSFVHASLIRWRERPGR